jgi:ribosomal-protein-alanine N-acetyltransferase
VKVRRATTDDLGGLTRLEEECFGAEKFSEAVLKAFLMRDDAFAIVAEEEGVVGAALCLCSASRAEGRIASIAVAGRERRKGVATALLRETEALLEGRGARTFGLEVEVENEPAISLYTKHGYTLRAMVRDYYGAGRHAYVMEKTLASKGPRVSVRPS